MVLFTRPVAIKKIFVGFANLGKTTGEVTPNKLLSIGNSPSKKGEGKKTTVHRPWHQKKRETLRVLDGQQINY